MPEFFSGVMVIIGGFVAWMLSMKNSRFAGFDICYGNSSMWPWGVSISSDFTFINNFVFGYIGWFDVEGASWIPTFITVVGAPPSIMLLYGPSIPALLTSSILGGLLCAPIAYWLGNSVIPVLGVPGVVANVSAMAISGIVICYIVKILPFVKPVPIKKYKEEDSAKPEDVYSVGWAVRRALAEFTEPHFYGNEIASIFLFIGLAVDCLLNGEMVVNGGGTVIGAVLLSQFVGAGIGIFLYAEKNLKMGDGMQLMFLLYRLDQHVFLMFGGTIPVALLSGVLGGIMGAPVADFFAGKLPDGVHGTNANVTSMALCTIITAIVLQGAWFLKLIRIH